MIRTNLKRKYLFIGIGLISFFILFIVFYLISTDDYSNAKFRTMQGNFSTRKKVDLTGLRDLKASGGPIINFSKLRKKLHRARGKIIIIDGMSEEHGYIGNISTTFFGYDYKGFNLLFFIRRLIFTNTSKILSKYTNSEAIIAKNFYFDYKHIQIESKFLTPDKCVDEFVSYIDKVPDNMWIYFHCRHGKGRTSMMLAMYDIMKNAPTVALKDIVKRQHLLGSVNLFDTRYWKIKGSKAYSSKTLEQRKKFIINFYTFICQRKAGGIKKWSDWHQAQKNETL